MNFVFRGTRADLEAGFPGIDPGRRTLSLRMLEQRIHAGRPANSNSLAFVVTVLVLFVVLNSQLSPNFLIWLVLGVFLMATTVRMYATCQQLQAQARAHVLSANGFLGQTELQLHVPPTIALATRGRLQSLRLQLALLDREFDDLDYDALRALDSENSPLVPSMTDEEINTLPVHKYKVQSCQGRYSQKSAEGSPLQASPTSGLTNGKRRETLDIVGSSNDPEDELTCSVCLELVNVGDIVRTLPCLHQFHVCCIDPWLRQQGTCPVCKHPACPEQLVAGNGEGEPSDIV